MKLTIAIPLLFAAMLGGCAKDTALFVTRTSFGIDIESKPPLISVAYDRTEGFYGPRYPNGAVPPVVGSIRTDGTVFNPRVRQTYATGNAAKIITSDGRKPDDLPLTPGEDVKPMFFGTSTTLGFKVGFTTTTGIPVPDSVTFGYKRKEASFIPLGTAGTEHVYPSVLAAIDTDSAFKEFEGTKNNTVQFFASGYAAEALATREPVRRLLIQEAEQAIAASPEALKASQTRVSVVRAQADEIADCVSGVDGIDKPLLTQILQKAGLDSSQMGDITSQASEAELRATLAEDYSQSVDAIYDAGKAAGCKAG